MILEILQELESNNSRNFKIELLTKNKDNELLKEVCRLANDPFTQFYQRKIPVYTKMSGNLMLDLNGAIEGLSILSTRTLTGNAAIAQLQMILCSVNVDDAEVIKRIIGKDLKCGVSTSTINKVWKNLIPEFPCMLCSPFEQKLVDKIKFPAIVQCLSSDWVVETNNGTFTIQDIVENDLDVMVKSYNHTTDMVEFNKVLNKSKTFNSFNEWYRITLNDGTVTKPLTGNHLVWVDNKKDYIRVDELSIDDAVLSLYKLKIHYGDVMIKKISKIEKVQCDSFLYDIEVENTNNFFADGLLVHNCKMDGMRFNAIVKFDRDLKGTVEFRSRNGKEISLLGSLEQEFIELAYGKDLVFDGELLVYDTIETDSNGKICDRQTGNGILNRAVKGTITKEQADRVVATLWDQIPYEDFIVGKCDQPYRYRLKRLDYLLARLPSETKIELVETFEVHSLEQTQEIFQQYLADGDEGIILKDPNSLWENKRSKGQIKFKAELDCDLKVVSVLSGTGKYADMIGSLCCESADGIVKVYVGSGFSDEQRSAPPSEYFDKIIAVKYNARIKNVQGEESLFLPIFLEVRNDKEFADVSTKIK